MRRVPSVLSKANHRAKLDLSHELVVDEFSDHPPIPWAFKFELELFHAKRFISTGVQFDPHLRVDLDGRWRQLDFFPFRELMLLKPTFIACRVHMLWRLRRL